MSAGTRSAEPARAIFQPAGASFEGNELRFVAVLVDVFDAQRGIQVPDMPRVGDGHAFDRGVRIPEIFREDEFGAFFDGLPQGGLHLAGVTGVALILDIDSQAARTGLRSGRSVSSIAGPHRSLSGCPRITALS